MLLEQVLPVQNLALQTQNVLSEPNNHRNNSGMDITSISEAPSRIYKMTMINMLKDLMSKMDNSIQKHEISKRDTNY